MPTFFSLVLPALLIVLQVYLIYGIAEYSFASNGAVTTRAYLAIGGVILVLWACIAASMFFGYSLFFDQLIRP